MQNEEEVSFNQDIIHGVCYSYGKAVLGRLLVKKVAPGTEFLTPGEEKLPPA